MTTIVWIIALVGAVAVTALVASFATIELMLWAYSNWAKSQTEDSDLF